MPKNAWLTPDLPPAGFTCRRLLIPDDRNWIAIVSGALELLTHEWNFELDGTATPAETAAVFSTMFDEFSLKGRCNMIGEIITWAGIVDPPDAGLLLCDGAGLDVADYPELYAAIGTTYGGDGAPLFYIPYLLSKNVIGAQPPGLPIGMAGGEGQHTLTTAELPAHTHVDSGHTHGEITAVPAVGAAIVGVPVPSAIPGAGFTGSGAANIQNTGGGAAFYLYSPFVAMRYYIQAK